MNEIENPENKTKRLIVFVILAFVLLFFNIAVVNDSAFYSQPICKVERIKTEQMPDISGDLGINEKSYSQHMTCQILNGRKNSTSSDSKSENDSYKNSVFTIDNMYTSSGISDTKYHTGDYLFLREIKTDSEGNVVSAVIDGQKRDYFLSALLSLVLLGAVITAGKRGASFAAALVVNIGVLTAGFALFQTSVSFVIVTASFLIIFPFISLLLCIGNNARMRSALLCTYAVIGVLTAVYCLFRRLSPDLDYTLQDYVRNGSLDIDLLLSCGTLVGSLGAIMDTAVSVTSGAAEIISRDPDITFEDLRTSVNDIGLDVTGTMINVLFYTYMAGRIPMCIMQLENGMPVYVMIRFYMPFEIIRFLTGAAGIALATIMSEYCTVKKMKVTS